MKALLVVSNRWMAKRGLSKSLLPILLFVMAFATWAQNPPSPKAPPPDQSISLFTNDTSQSELIFKPTRGGIWKNGVGEGFKSAVQSISSNSLVAGYGLKILGSEQRSRPGFWPVFRMATCLVRSKGKATGIGAIGSCAVSCLAVSNSHQGMMTSCLGLTPHLRYNFATGARWIPYVDGGAGVTVTSIGPPDLSHTFEFNSWAAASVRWFTQEGQPAW